MACTLTTLYQLDLVSNASALQHYRNDLGVLDKRMFILS